MQLLKYILVIPLLILFSNLSAQGLYLRTFGNPDDPSVVYLHGGPGGSSIYFENLIAEELSNQGYYVIIYDRPGDGRSKDLRPNSTFNGSVNTLDSILSTLKLEGTTLIGHSFGGFLALMYAKAWPRKTNSVIITASPLSMYKTGLYILKEVKREFKKNGKESLIEGVNKLEQINRDSCKHGFVNIALSYAHMAGLLTKDCPKTNNLSLKYESKVDSIKAIYTPSWRNSVSRNYELNESYSCKNFSTVLSEVIGSKVDVKGIFGQNDIYVPPDQLEKYINLLGEDSVKVIKGACHNVKITHRNEYMAALVEFLSRN